MAQTAAQVDPKIRAKLYGALKRIMASGEADKVYVPAAVMCRYSESVKKGKNQVATICSSCCKSS